MCYRTRDVEIAELRGAVAALAARVVALERAVREKSLVSDTANSRRFLIAIAEIVKGHAFTSAELMAHARDVSPTLRQAFAAAGVTSARRLGKRLQRLQGRPLGGLYLERVGADYTGAIWLLRVVADSQVEAGVPA